MSLGLGNSDLLCACAVKEGNGGSEFNRTGIARIVTRVLAK